MFDLTKISQALAITVVGFALVACDDTNQEAQAPTAVVETPAATVAPSEPVTVEPTLATESEEAVNEAVETDEEVEVPQDSIIEAQETTGTDADVQEIPVQEEAKKAE